jgi:hypothetical protein
MLGIGVEVGGSLTAIPFGVGLLSMAFRVLWLVAQGSLVPILAYHTLTCPPHDSRKVGPLWHNSAVILPKEAALLNSIHHSRRFRSNHVPHAIVDESKKLASMPGSALKYHVQVFILCAHVEVPSSFQSGQP